MLNSYSVRPGWSAGSVNRELRRRDYGPDFCGEHGIKSCGHPRIQTVTTCVRFRLSIPATAKQHRGRLYLQITTMHKTIQPHDPKYWIILCGIAGASFSMDFLSASTP